MTEANIVTIDTNNYESMAKAMGIANETNVVEKKAPQLPRFRINHAPIEEDDEINKVIFILKSINEDMNSIINQQFRIDFNVPLLLEAKIGDNWLDTKDVS